MGHPQERAAHVDAMYPRDQFVALVSRIMPQVSTGVEHVLWLLLVCAFWGMIVYSAALVLT